MNNTLKHTAGPWEIDYCSANRAYEIFPVKKDGRFDIDNEVCMTADDNLSNARLIASAPELLEACKDALNCAITDKNLILVAILKQAIAKAEGKS